MTVTKRFLWDLVATLRDVERLIWDEEGSVCERVRTLKEIAYDYLYQNAPRTHEDAFCGPIDTKVDPTPAPVHKWGVQ